MTTTSKRAEAMRRLRKERRSSGLVEFRRWVKPKTKIALDKLADEMEAWQARNTCKPADMPEGV